jgi:hypothetical protein
LQETSSARKSALGYDLPVRSLQDAPISGGPIPSPSQQPTNTAGSPGTSSFIMDTVNSAIALIRNPVSYIAANKDTPATTRGIMVNYVAVLAAIPFLATLIGDLWYYSLFIPLGFAGSYVAYSFTSAVLTYILDVVGVYVIAIVIGMLAPTFNSSADQVKSLKLAAFIFTPVFLIGILDIIPLLAFLTILGVLYGLYILYLGLPVMLGTPRERVVTYVVAVVVATFVVYLVIGAIIGVISAAVFHLGMGFL